MSFFRTAVQAVTGHGLEMPRYDVTETHKEYEVRHYPESHWVSTEVTSSNRKEAVSVAFRRLFKYITGDNNKDVKVPMTAPVATKQRLADGDDEQVVFTTSFFVGKDFQEDTPSPSNPAVFLQKLPPMDVYVRRFSGFTDDRKWITEAETLRKCVTDGGGQYITDFYYTAGYDSPFKLYNRRNEIWWRKDVQ